MTQGIQHHTGSAGTERRDGWLVEALNDLFRVLITDPTEHLPERLAEDVGLGTNPAQEELHADYNRLDAQLHARFY
jgi:hypothetical protein